MPAYTLCPQGYRMKVKRRIELARFMINQFLQAQLQRASMKTGRVLCRPTSVYSMITSRCDLRCVMCEWWKRPAIEELPTEVWTDTLSHLRKWLGPFHINFNGGEIFLREDMIDILNYASSQGIMAGIVTNAFHVDRELARDIIKAGPFNINISLDGVDRKTHDGLRGTKGVFERVMQTVDHLIEFKEYYGSDSRIIIKPTVMTRNLEEMPALVKWAQGKGHIVINLQPVIPTWTKGAQRQFNIETERLDEIVDTLIHYKQHGAPILNPVSHLESLKAYFRDETPPIFENDSCYVGLKNFFIHPSGDVYLCEHDYGPVGNITEQRPVEIWRSEKAEWAREKIRRCRKSCLQTCTVRRSFREDLDLFQKLVLKNR
jgi:radical SAM protein with 4Fe4S-binding SPASM domain